MMAMGSSEIDNVPQRYVIDYALVDYKINKDIEEKTKDQKQFFDNSMEAQISASMVSNPISQGTNRRGITWNIPRLDLIWRSSPYVKRSVDWLSSKLLINGIDINSPDRDIESEELSSTQQFFKKLYRPMQKMAEWGFVYGGAGAMIVIKGRQSESDLKKPLDVRTVKKGEFIGLKPLARWYQIEPALDKGLISEISEENGIYDADLIGQPEYYRVNFSGGLSGFSGNNSKSIQDNGFKMQGQQYLVHRSWLLIFNPYSLSHIESQIERYWSSSIIETASVDMECDC